MQEPLDAWFKREILQHEAALLRYLTRVWPRKHEVQDLRQETYARVYAAAMTSRPASPRSFLFTTAHHLMADLWSATISAGPLLAESILFTRAPTSTRGAIQRVLGWPEPNKNHRADAATSTTARSNSREGRERYPNASRSCCRVHCAVGYAVTLK
ncbi:RNA polymerase sigma factor [Peristeroidobacter soli]|uniref:RNA polymerase sigma factor n=1 Tax=Peristeroidobacter soli TaxID=2497877 RepID=UPI00101C2346